MDPLNLERLGQYGAPGQKLWALAILVATAKGADQLVFADGRLTYCANGVEQDFEPPPPARMDDWLLSTFAGPGNNSIELEIAAGARRRRARVSLKQINGRVALTMTPDAACAQEAREVLGRLCVVAF